MNLFGCVIVHYAKLKPLAIPLLDGYWYVKATYMAWGLLGSLKPTGVTIPAVHLIKVYHVFKCTRIVFRTLAMFCIHAVAMGCQSEAEKGTRQRYQDELRRQIEEKKKQQEIEKQKEQEEDQRLLRKIEEDNRRMQEELENEKRKEREKLEAVCSL